MPESFPDRGKRVDESGWFFIALAAAATMPAALFRFEILSASVEIETVVFGIAILGAAFLLSWGAEVAQLDISQSLAIAFVAFVAVLPEYAVDLTFAWKAGQQDAVRFCEAVVSSTDPCSRELTIANMTGANRLLIGLGWAAVVLIWSRRSKQRAVSLETERRTELGFLMLATLWALSIPIRGSLSVVDLVVLLAVFAGYIWRAAQHESEHPDLVGPPIVVAALPVARRRAVTVGLFVFAAAMILVAAEPFAEGLVVTGRELGISPFLLVQWLAPLASEAPEMIVAILLVLRSQPGVGLGALLSSKVNQWTLLIAMIPLVYMVARGGLFVMPLDSVQVQEVLLTATASVFAVAVIANLSLSRLEAIVLLVLFLAQFGWKTSATRYGFTIAYATFALVVLVRDASARAGLKAALRDALTLPWRSRSQRPTSR